MKKKVKNRQRMPFWLPLCVFKMQPFLFLKSVWACMCLRMTVQATVESSSRRNYRRGALGLKMRQPESTVL